MRQRKVSAIDRPVVLMTLRGVDIKEGKIPDSRYSIVTPTGYKHTIHRDPDFIVSPDGKFDLWPVDSVVQSVSFYCPECEFIGTHPHGWMVTAPGGDKYCIAQCCNCAAFHWFKLMPRDSRDA